MPEFEPTPTFCGYREGMVFKLGDKGQGYYKDDPNKASEKDFAGQLSFYPAATFAGALKGMVFRKGDRGQGYYLDNPFNGKKLGERVDRPVRNA